MKLTPQGERLYVFAKQFLEQASNFEKAFHEKENEVNGDIKIITTPFVGTDWLVPILKDFLERYSDINIQVLLRSENINPNEGGTLLYALLFPINPILSKSIFYYSGAIIFKPIISKKIWNSPNSR